MLNRRTLEEVRIGADPESDRIAISPALLPAGKGELPLSAVLLVVGLALTAMPAPRRRRIVFGAILAIALAATQLGCGGGGGNAFHLVSSSQTVAQVTANFTSGVAVGVSGLPANLGTISVL